MFSFFFTILLTGTVRGESKLPSIVQLKSKYSYYEMCNDIEELCMAYPDILSSKSGGTSMGGLDIPLLILGNKEAAHSIMIQSSIHGREYIVSQVTMAIIEYYAKEFSRGKLGDLYKSTCFYIVPMANPDGVIIAQAADPEWKSNMKGVDINRNFPAMWDSTISRDDPSSMNFKGHHAASESETRALMSIAKARDYSCFISYHQKGDIIYYDDDYTTPQVSEMSALLAERFSRINMYEPVNAKLSGEDGMTTMGGFNDWVQLSLQKPGITVECGSAYGAAGQSQAISIYLRNLATWEAAARLFP
ncbi:MAG: hypothetical protein K5931_11100 [Lachnospiraceae bacterium]|nr:hypothetical protein [Lachnospiraceae bacterium]